MLRYICPPDSLDEIPEGALFLRPKGYNGFLTGHGATFDQRISATELVINHAANSTDNILSKSLTIPPLPIRRLERFRPIAYMN